MTEGIALDAALEIDVEGSSVLANQPIETNVTPLGPSDQIPRPIGRRHEYGHFSEAIVGR